MNKEEMKQQVLIQIEAKTAQLKAEIEALRSIRRLAKKDGSDFTNIHKNFASSTCTLSWQDGVFNKVKNLAVSYTYDTTDHTDIYGTVWFDGDTTEGSDLFNELKAKGLEVVGSGYGCIKDYIALDADAFQKQILDRIECDETATQQLEQSRGLILAAASEMYDLAEAINNKRKELDETTGFGYMVSDVLKNAIFYEL